jgi:hypothetical protein
MNSVDTPPTEVLESVSRQLNALHFVPDQAQFYLFGPANRHEYPRGTAVAFETEAQR